MSVSLDEIVLSRLSPDFEVHNTSALEEAMLDEPSYVVRHFGS